MYRKFFYGVVFALGVSVCSPQIAVAHCLPAEQAQLPSRLQLPSADTSRSAAQTALRPPCESHQHTAGHKHRGVKTVAAVTAALKRDLASQR